MKPFVSMKIPMINTNKFILIFFFISFSSIQATVWYIIMVWSSPHRIKITMRMGVAVHNHFMVPGGIRAAIIPIWTGCTWVQLQMTANQIRGTTGKIDTNLYKQQGWWYVLQIFRYNVVNLNSSSENKID